jgi:hypothetical protein
MLTIQQRAKSVSFTDKTKFTKSQKFIEQNKKKLEESSTFFNPDTTLMRVEEYLKADLRILIVFGSPASVRSVSSTAPSLNSFVKEICNVYRPAEKNAIPQVPYAKPVPEPHERQSLNIFIDFTYVPNASDIKVFDKNNMPYAIGNITHLDASYFDIVGFSISVLSEVITCPSIIKSFSRCDVPIPLTWTERKNTTLNLYPLIYAGGITAACSDIMFGELGDGRQAFVDFLYLGSCEKMDIMWERHEEALRHNKQVSELDQKYQTLLKGEDLTLKQIRVKYTDEFSKIPIYAHNDVEVSELITNQDYIDSLFDMPMVYQPQAYKVVYDNRNRIIENTKINKFAQDFVKPFYPLEMDEDAMGIGMTIIQANGDNLGTSQVQVSEGCSAGGQCSFCSEGCYTGGWIEKSRERILYEARESKKYSAGYKMKPFSFNALSASTIVPVGDGKFKRLRDVAYCNNVITFDNQKSTLEGVIPEKHTKMLSFLLERGEAPLMSLEHRQWVLTENGLEVKLAKDIKVGDYLPVQVGYYTDLVERVKRGTKYYFLGLWYGDGSRSGSYRDEIWRYTRQFVSEKELAIKKLCDDSEFFKYKDNENRDDHVCSYTYTDEFQEFVKSVFPKYKYDDSNILDLNINQLLEFIAGVYDADGSASCSNVVLSLSVKSTELQKVIGIVLNSIGIQYHAQITRRKYDGEWKYFNNYRIIGKSSYRTFKRVIGFEEKEKHDKIRDCNILSKCVDKALPSLVGPYLYSKIKEIEPSFHSTAINSAFLHGKQGMLIERFIEVFGKYNIPIVNHIKNGMSFSFIEEIQVNEGEFDCIDLLETENHTYVAMGCLTHNCNYVVDYKGLLYELMKIYPKITFINMRMEELGRDLDALRMMKLVGSNRISAPMEGISPRTQNNVLNKCLSEEALNNFMDDMVHAKLTDIKVGGIFTGLETDEDFQWICDFVDKYKVRAAKEGGNFPFRLKVTPLVCYNLTTCEYFPRKSAEKSFKGEHWLTDEWYEKFREHNVFFKVNGFRYSTFIEQSIIDLGRSATKWMYDNIISKDLPVYSLRSFATEEIVNNLKKLINVDWFFKERHPRHYISPSHRVHIDLMGSYIPRALRAVEHYQKDSIFNNEQDIRCLKTYDGAPVKCYASCMTKDPLKIYNDVKLDVNDNLIGEDFRMLKGCERCPDKEHKMQRLSRSTPQTKNCEDIIALPKLKPVIRVRFVLNRSKEYDVLNMGNTAHTFMSKFLQRSEELTDMFHKVDTYSGFWQHEATMLNSEYGLQFVDVLFRDRKAYDIIMSLKDEVNKGLISTQILDVKKLLVEDALKVDDWCLYKFTTSLPYELFTASSLQYKGEVRVLKDINFDVIQDKDLKFPAFTSVGKVTGYFALQMKYNPLYFLQGALNAKKVRSIIRIISLMKLSCKTS